MLDAKLVTFFGYSPIEGDVGIEIEMEGNNPFPKAPKGWTSHTDGSLQGAYNVEYVSTSPIHFEEVEGEVEKIVKSLANNNVEIVPSIRAGIHVHVNCHDLTIEETLNFALTYLTLETVLVKYCGENRENNLFCLRSSDAEYLIYLLECVYRSNNLNHLSSDIIRYSSINFNALFKFGSLEFRALETKPDLSNIKDWVGMLLKVKEYGVKLNSKTQIPMDISFNSPSLWAKSVLGDYYYDLIKYEGMEKDIMRDLRNLQTIIYR